MEESEEESDNDELESFEAVKIPNMGKKSREKIFDGEVCEKKFTTKWHLNKHKKLHSSKYMLLNFKFLSNFSLSKPNQ